MSVNPQWIEDKQREYRRLEAPAARALEYTKSPQYAEDSVKILEKIATIVGTLPMTDHQALMAIGRIQQVIESWKEPSNAIVAFESVKQSLNQILKS